MNRRKGFGFGLKAAIAMLLAVGAGLLALSQVSAQDPTLSVDRITIAFGEEGTVDLASLDIDPPGLGAWEIGIAYDPSVASAVSCTEFGGSVCNPGFAPNQVRVTGASASGHTGDKVLAEITFACNSTEGITSLTLIVDIFSDATIGAPVAISHDVVHGSVSCVEAGTGPVPTATRQPEDPDPTTEEDPTDAPPADATATPGSGVNGLPNVGSGGSTGTGTIGWLIAGLAAIGLATTTVFGALRLRTRKASLR